MSSARRRYDPVMPAWMLASVLVAAPVEGSTPVEEPLPVETPPVETPPAEPAPAEPAPAETAPAPEPVVSSCPCAPDDRACRQQHTDVCLWAGGAAAPTSEPSTGSSDGATPKTKAPGKWHRTGVFLGGGIGYGTCLAAYCEGYRGGFGYTAEIGWRWRYVGPVITLGGSVGPRTLDVFPGFDGRMSIFDVGVGVLFFPAQRSLFDPFLGFTLAYSSAKLTLHDEDVAITEQLSRGGVRLIAGIMFYVHPMVGLGPRLDFTLPFAGKTCVKGSDRFGTFVSECESLADLPSDSQIDPRDLPKPLSVTLNVRVTIPTPMPQRK